MDLIFDSSTSGSPRPAVHDAASVVLRSANDAGSVVYKGCGVLTAALAPTPPYSKRARNEIRIPLPSGRCRGLLVRGRLRHQLERFQFVGLQRPAHRLLQKL